MRPVMAKMNDFGFGTLELSVEDFSKEGGAEV